MVFTNKDLRDKFDAYKKNYHETYEKGMRKKSKCLGIADLEALLLELKSANLIPNSVDTNDLK